jgi:hypothetical protein
MCYIQHPPTTKALQIAFGRRRLVRNNHDYMLRTSESCHTMWSYDAYKKNGFRTAGAADEHDWSKALHIRTTCYELAKAATWRGLTKPTRKTVFTQLAQPMVTTGLKRCAYELLNMDLGTYGLYDTWQEHCPTCHCTWRVSLT